MGWGKKVLRRFRASGRIEGFECEIRAELLFHLEMRTLDNLDAGMAPEVAREEALRRFGDFEHINHLCRQARRASRLAKVAKAVRLLTLPMALTGIAIISFNEAEEIKHLGQLLIVIAILLRLLVHAKGLHLNPHPGAEPVPMKLFDADADRQRAARIE